MGRFRDCSCQFRSITDALLFPRVDSLHGVRLRRDLCHTPYAIILSSCSHIIPIGDFFFSQSSAFCSPAAFDRFPHSALVHAGGGPTFAAVRNVRLGSHGDLLVLAANSQCGPYCVLRHAYGVRSNTLRITPAQVPGLSCTPYYSVRSTAPYQNGIQSCCRYSVHARSRRGSVLSMILEYYSVNLNEIDRNVAQINSWFAQPLNYPVFFPFLLPSYCFNPIPLFCLSLSPSRFPSHP